MQNATKNEPQKPQEQQQQQAPEATTFVQVGTPRTAAIPYQDQIRRNEWAAELTDCCDFCVPNGLMACCCPFVSLAQTAVRLHLAKYSGALLVFFVLEVLTEFVFGGSIPKWMCRGGDCGATMTSVFCVIGVVAWIVHAWLAARMRRHIRRRFDIDGDLCTDMMVSCWCLWCSAAQMATHVKSYRPGGCSFAAPPQLLAPYEP